MAACNFLTPVLPFVLKEEGGVSDDAQDPGGFTDHGITLQTYREWVRDPHFTQAQLEALTPAQIAAFYGTLWNQVRGDELPAGTDAMVMDHYVNSGTNSGKVLQRVLGFTGTDVDGWIGAQTLAAVRQVDVGHLALRMLPAGVKVFQAAGGLAVDGKVGPITMAAMRAHPGATLVCALRDAQDSYYRGLPGFAHDGRGWEARLGRRAALAASLALPAGARLQAPI